MVESIVKLRVDNKDFDPKIRSAHTALLRLEDSLRDTGKTFSDASKEQVGFANALGNMATRSASVRGKINELTAAYTDLSAQYRRMTDEEKNSDYGKSLSSSLDRLKARIQDSRKELGEINTSLAETGNESQTAGNGLGDLAEKFGLTLPKVTGLAGALGAASAALKVTKDAFFANESAVDEWGRTMEAGRAVYDSFLQTLNSGNFGGFLTNLGNVISKAREAYDAIDHLNTVMTIINPERTKIQARQTQLQATIRRAGVNSEEGKKAQEELRALEPKLQKAYRREAGMNWHAFETLVDEQLATANIHLDKRSKDFLMRSFHDTDTFNRLSAGARGEASRRVSVETPFGRGVSHTRDTRNTNQKLLDLFTDEWRQKNSPYLSAAFGALGQSYGVLKADARYLSGGSGGGSSRGGSNGGNRGGRTDGGTVTAPPPPAGSIAEQEKKIQDLRTAWKNAADDDSRRKIAAEITDATSNLDEMKKSGEKSAPVGSMKYYSEWLKELQEKQQEVTTRNDWEFYAGQIDFVTKKMKELRGETEKLPEMETGLRGMSSESIGGWVQQLQQSLAAKDIGSEEWQKTFANITDAQTLSSILTESAQKGLDLAAIGVDTEAFWDQIIGGENIDDSTWQDLVDKINEALAKLGLDPIKLDVETGNITTVAKKTKEGWQDAARAVQAVGSALQQVENPAAKIAGIVGEAIANIALGFAQATAKDSGGGVWAWIAAIAGGMGTMLSTISAIKSATAGSYAEGGIVPGNNYNDGLVANVSSGELILNRAQQGNIASQLEGGIGNLKLDAKLSGEDIILAITRTNKRMGRGEYAYSKSR